MTNPALDFLSRAWRVAVMADRDGAGVSPQAIRMHNATERELRVAGAWAYDGVINRGIADWLRDISSDLGTCKAYLASIDADLTDGGESAATLLRRILETERTTIYASPADVALPAGAALQDLSGWVDLGRWSVNSGGIRNVLAVNPVTQIRIDWSPDNGVTVYQGQATAFTIAASTGVPVALDATTASLPYSSARGVGQGFRYVRLMAGSALGTSARAIVCGSSK